MQRVEPAGLGAVAPAHVDRRPPARRVAHPWLLGTAIAVAVVFGRVPLTTVARERLHVDGELRFELCPCCLGDGKAPALVTEHRQELFQVVHVVHAKAIGTFTRFVRGHAQVLERSPTESQRRLERLALDVTHF